MKTKNQVPHNSKKMKAKEAPGITYPLNRQSTHATYNLRGATASIDWYEIGAVVTWDRDSLPELEEALLNARKARRSVKCDVGPHSVLIQPKGFGKGRESRMRYKITWRNIVVGVSARRSTNRQLCNFYLWAAGTACVVLGLEAILEFQHSLIKSLGGRLEESWIKRIDFCLDIRDGAVLDELIQRLRNGCFVTSCRNRAGQNVPLRFLENGFAIRSKNIRLTAYDKIAEMKADKRGVEYRQAMIRNRWGGELPASATRIEFQVRKGRLYGLNMKTAFEVLNRLHEVVVDITSEAPRSFFRITECPPDSKNGHQSRAKTLPLWTEIIEGLRRGVHPPSRRQMRQFRGLRTNAMTQTAP